MVGRVTGHLIRVAVAGAAGRMGQTVCAAVEDAECLELTGRADPALGTSVADVLGDADVLVMNMNEPPSLLRNGYQGDHGWVQVALEGRRSNRSAIGATVIVTANGKRQARAG